MLLLIHLLPPTGSRSKEAAFDPEISKDGFIPVSVPAQSQTQTGASGPLHRLAALRTAGFSCPYHRFDHGPEEACPSLHALTFG